MAEEVAEPVRERLDDDADEHRPDREHAAAARSSTAGDSWAWCPASVGDPSPAPRRSGSTPGTCRTRSGPRSAARPAAGRSTRRVYGLPLSLASVQRFEDHVLAPEAGRAAARPASAAAPHRNVRCVTGITFRRPPNRRMSMTSPIACITLPAARNSSALKKACVNRWKIAAVDRERRARSRPPRAERQEHEPELADGRVREDALQVGLRQRDERGEQRRDPADPRDRSICASGAQREQRRAAGEQVDAGRHHRRGVDQRRDRRRAFHRVRQPDVQRELRRLADRPAEQQQARGRERRRGPAGASRCGRTAPSGRCASRRSSTAGRCRG